MRVTDSDSSELRVVELGAYKSVEKTGRKRRRRRYCKDIECRCARKVERGR